MKCVIPARGGSTRIPGKNLLKIGGEYSINLVVEICESSGLFDEIVCSTDSTEIAGIVDCDVLMREKKGDGQETDVLKEFINAYGVDEGVSVYSFACLLTPERLITGYEFYEADRYDYVMECLPYSHPPIRAINWRGQYQHPEIVDFPTQIWDPMYYPAATYRYFSREALDKKLGECNIKWVPISEMEAQDVDELDDVELLKYKMRRKKNVSQVSTH